LVQGGLVIQERRGREIINRADYAATATLLSFLTDECCVGVALIEEAAA
jgi:ArsR family transcriptional regulator